jgi:hypothetical protein
MNSERSDVAGHFRRVLAFSSLGFRWASCFCIASHAVRKLYSNLLLLLFGGPAERALLLPSLLWNMKADLYVAIWMG